MFTTRVAVVALSTLPLTLVSAQANSNSTFTIDPSTVDISDRGKFSRWTPIVVLGEADYLPKLLGAKGRQIAAARFVARRRVMGARS